jgi:hypothetical protein
MISYLGIIVAIIFLVLCYQLVWKREVVEPPPIVWVLKVCYILAVIVCIADIIKWIIFGKL